MPQDERFESEVFCDICAANCHRGYNNEHAELRATWGYESNKDLTRHSINICESCFDQTIAFLRSIRTAPVDRGLDPLDGIEYDLA